MTRVAVKPSLLHWAVERAGLDPLALARRFPKLPDWERGTLNPTLKQLEGFAQATHTPIGYLFLPEPPARAPADPGFPHAGESAPSRRPSPDLLDTLYLCQQRQDWYRDFARVDGGRRRLPFVGSARAAATTRSRWRARMRAALGFDLDERRRTCRPGPTRCAASSSRPTRWACW